MGLGTFRAVLAALLLAVGAPSLAQPRAPSADVAAAVDRAVFAEATRWKSKLRASEAAAVDAIQAQRREIERLKQQARSSEQARRSLAGEIGRREREADARTGELLAEIDRRDDEIARLLQGFRRNITQLTQSPQGREALALYNEGRPVESDALIARLDEQELAGARLAVRVNEAARYRRRAELLHPKIGQGGVTIESVIRLFEQAVERDDAVQSDWVNLANLYTAQHRKPQAEAAVRRARALAARPFEATQASLAAAGLASDGADMGTMLTAMGEAFAQLRREIEANPQIKARFARELAILTAIGTAYECVDKGRLTPCFETRIAEAEGLLRDYNSLPQGERMLLPIFEPHTAALRAMYHSIIGSDRAIPLFQAVIDRVRALIPNYAADRDSLDLLFTAHSQIAGRHLQADRFDEALAAYQEALSHQRRLIALDPTAVQPKLLHALVAAAAGFLALHRDDRLSAVSLLDEAGRAIADAIRLNDFPGAHQIRWRVLILTALLDPRGSEADSVLQGLAEARAKGHVADFEAAMVDLLRQARSQAAAGDR
jgi:tetratricopeptide (TPR) repeat protein